MFIVFLKLADKTKIAENRAGHNVWLKSGFDQGAFLLAGTIEQIMSFGLIVHRP